MAPPPNGRPFGDQKEADSDTPRSKQPDAGCILCDCIYVPFWKMQNSRDRKHTVVKKKKRKEQNKKKGNTVVARSWGKARGWLQMSLREL